MFRTVIGLSVKEKETVIEMFFTARICYNMCVCGQRETAEYFFSLCTNYAHSRAILMNVVTQKEILTALSLEFQMLASLLIAQYLTAFTNLF